MATSPYRLPDRDQPRRRSGVRGHPQPVRDAQPFAEDDPGFVAVRRVSGRQQPSDRRTVRQQPGNQVGPQVRRPAVGRGAAVAQPAGIGRVRGQLDTRVGQREQQRREFRRVGVAAHKSAQPPPAFVAVSPRRSPSPKALTRSLVSILGGFPVNPACFSPRCSLGGV